MPSLLKVVKSLCDAQIQAEENLDVGKNDNDEFTSDEVESALSLLNVLITEVGGKAYYPYFTLTAQLILPLCAFESSEGVRKAAGKTLPSLLDCLKESQQSNPVAITETTKGFLSTLFEQIWKEYDPEVIQDLVYSTKDCILAIGSFLNPPEYTILSHQILKLLLRKIQLI